MRRQLLVIGIALSIQSAGPAPAYACTCPAQTPLASARTADVIFTGVVRSVSGGVPYGVTCTPDSSVAVGFHVETVYKGDVTASVSVLAGGRCGSTFARDGRYTVFLLSVAGRLDAGTCRRHVAGPIAAADYGLPARRAPRD